VLLGEEIVVEVLLGEEIVEIVAEVRLGEDDGDARKKRGENEEIRMCE
jgi:hypothetical protein